MAEQNDRLRGVLTMLERCQADLSDPSDDESRRLLSILLLQLQTRLHRIADAELGEFCKVLARNGRSRTGSVQPLRERKS